MPTIYMKMSTLDISIGDSSRLRALPNGNNEKLCIGLGQITFSKPAYYCQQVYKYGKSLVCLSVQIRHCA